MKVQHIAQAVMILIHIGHRMDLHVLAMFIISMKVIKFVNIAIIHGLIK